MLTHVHVTYFSSAQPDAIFDTKLCSVFLAAPTKHVRCSSTAQPDVMFDTKLCRSSLQHPLYMSGAYPLHSLMSYVIQSCFQSSLQHPLPGLTYMAMQIAVRPDIYGSANSCEAFLKAAEAISMLSLPIVSATILRIALQSVTKLLARQITCKIWRTNRLSAEETCAVALS